MLSELVSVFIGTALGGGLNIFRDHRLGVQKRKCVASAFYAEIDYIMRACRFWKYEVIIESYKRQATRKKPIPSKLPNNIDKTSAFKIYNELTKEMMLLPQPIVKNILLFYGNLFAVLDDMQYAYSNWQTNKNVYPVQILVDVYTRDLGLYKQAMITGDLLLKELARYNERK